MMTVSLLFPAMGGFRASAMTGETPSSSLSTMFAVDFEAGHVYLWRGCSIRLANESCRKQMVGARCRETEASF